MGLSNKPDKTSRSYTYDPSLKKCTVRNATELPQEIFEIAEDIEILDASFGGLFSLPDNLPDLNNLRIAFFSNNNFTSLPKVLASCPRLEMVGFKSCKISGLDAQSLPSGLRGLILTDNHITQIPESVGQLTSLQKLMLTGNSISQIPHDILACQNLQLLRLSLNQLEKSPDFIFQLPNLAWYSDSGNPFNRNHIQAVEAPRYRWKDVVIQEELGRSAKNVVYGASMQDKEVAVKVFGDGITTDGDPSVDMYISLAAGNHPNLIGGLGIIKDNPEGKLAFVMPKIPADYQTLGLPPDFHTLTRDTYAEGTEFAAEFVRRMAADISSAMAHLAGRGIQHGDLYAHNILTRTNGASILGDFEAASKYTPDSESGLLRERVDVRGFGNLLDDVLKYCHSGGQANLTSLRDACLQTDPTHRPTFQDIAASFT